MLNIETKELKISDKLKRKFDIGWKIYNTTPIIKITITSLPKTLPYQKP